MTLILHTPEGILTLTLAPHVVATSQNLARELRLQGVPPEKCGAWVGCWRLRWSWEG